MWLRAVRAKTSGRSLQRIELGSQKMRTKYFCNLPVSKISGLNELLVSGIPYFIYIVILFTFNFFYITVTMLQRISVMFCVTATKNQNHNCIHTSLFFPCPNSLPLRKQRRRQERCCLPHPFSALSHDLYLLLDSKSV